MTYKLEDEEPFQSFPKLAPKKKKSKTKEESYHLNWVASQGCMICGCRPNVHHIREHGERKDHFKTIPLCYLHHQGELGIHTLGKYEWRKKYGHELEMLEKLLETKP